MDQRTAEAEDEAELWSAIIAKSVSRHFQIVVSAMVGFNGQAIVVDNYQKPVWYFNQDQKMDCGKNMRFTETGS